MRISSALMALLVAGVLVLPASAAVTVIAYDKDLQAGGNLSSPSATGSLELDNDGNANDGFAQIALDTTTPYSETAGDYTGPAFFLGYLSTQYNTAEGWDSKDSNPLSIRHQVGGDDGFGNPKVADFHLALYFETAGGVTFDSASILSVNFNRFESLGDVRWLVRDGTDFYVSQTTLSGDTTFDAAGGLLTEMWADYDPVTDVNFDAGAAVFDTATTDFSGVTAVGLVADKDNLSGVRHWFGFDTFEVVAVPEPATMGLLGLGALALICRRRKA